MPGTHPITETSCKEGAEPSPRPVVNLQNKVYCCQHRSGMKIKSSLVQMAARTWVRVFRPLYIPHQTLCSERFPDPPVIVRLDPYYPRQEHLRYRLRLSSFSIGVPVIRKEPLSKRVNQIACRSSFLIDLARRCRGGRNLFTVARSGASTSLQR